MRSPFRSQLFLRRFRRFVCLAIATTLLCLWTPTLVGIATASIGTVQTQQASASLEQQGRSAYMAEDFAAAAAAFEQAATQYQAAGQPVRAALAFANLSLSYQQLSQWSNAEAAIQNALALVSVTDDMPAGLWDGRGQVLSIQGQLRFSQGDNTAAAEAWEQAAAAYAKAEQPDEQARTLVNRAQALQASGFYARALSQVKSALALQPSGKVEVDALRLHGDLLRLTGQREQAATALTQALGKAEALEYAIASVNNSLGMLAEANGDSEGALEYYQAAAEVSTDSASSAKLSIAAQISQLQLLIDQSDWQAIATLLPPLTEQIQSQSLNREAVYARLTYAQVLLDLRPTVDQAFAEREAELAAANIEPPAQTDSNPSTEQLPVLEDPQLSQDAALQMLADALPTGDAIATLLLESYSGAQTFQDIKAQSYALGNLGKLYSQTQQWEIAKQQTLDALKLAQGGSLPELEYQLQEQLCQILQNIEDTPSGEAIKACRAAVDTTNLLRNDLAAKGEDTAFEFQEQVDPIYRNLIDLLLRTDKNDPAYKDNLKEARKTLESLKLAELDNFFREACLEIQSVELDEVVDEKTAVIYPIILENRLEIILSLPGTITHHSSRIGKADLNEIIRAWIEGITFQADTGFPKNTNQALTPYELQGEGTPVSQLSSQQLLYRLYQWLISPLEEDLASTDVNTLVFVLDSTLRNIPMSALYNGQRYLIEEYAVALTPGLQLIDPQPIARDSIQAFLAGVSKEQKLNKNLSQDFAALPNVETELNKISEIVQGNVLWNEDVTNASLEVEIATSPAPIVHIATHGKFSDNLEDTFIVTWQGQLQVNELSQLLKTSELSRERQLELLILSACETAKGNDRSVLGIAGVATRSGARSTLATLWLVNDSSTAELMIEFYKQLTASETTKAQALQQAQLKVLNTTAYSDPFYWAPFILLGNWL